VELGRDDGPHLGPLPEQGPALSADNREAAVHDA
jgi:hypothetical protein